MPPRGGVRSPAFTACVLLAVGIGLGSSLPASVPWMAASGGALLLLWLSFLGARSLRRGRLCSLFRAGCAWIVTGAVLALVSGSRVRQDIPCSGFTATVAGAVADPPTRTASGLRFLLHPEWISAGEESLSVTGLIAVTLLLRSGDPPLPVPGYGDRLCLRGFLSEPPGLRNPGEFDLRQYYAASGIRALLLVRGADACLRLPGSEGDWFYATLVFPVRRAVLAYFDRVIGGPEGEFLKGLVLGIRSGMTPAMREAFVNAGVAHILAVSGSNVAVIAGFLYGLFLLLRIPGVLRDLCVAAGILYYMVLTGSQPPVVRATIMALIVLAGRRMERPVSAVNSLGVAGLLILLLHPAQLFDVGFQLSFSAVLAIVVLYDRSATLLRGISSRGRAGRAVRALLALVAVSLVATIGTLPLTALHFERVSVIGLVANMVVVPASGLSVVLGLAGVVSDLLSNRVGEAYAALNVVLLHWTLAFTMLAGSSPLAVVHTSGWSVLSSLGIVLALLSLLYLGTRRAGRLLIAALGVWNLALLLPSGAIGPAPPGVLRVLFVDVGQGDCALIQFPGGTVMAIDVGDRTPRLDQGERTIIPLLHRLGIETMESIILTHPHRDHIGGFPALSRGLGVRRTYCSAVGQWPLQWELDPLGAGEFLSPASNVRLYVLWPSRPGRTVPMPSLDGNNGSLVLRLQYGAVSFLFTGDIGQPVEARVASAYGDFLRCNILKVPHHGAATGCSQTFLSAVAPEHAIVSVGTGNRFSHPAPEVLERMRVAGVRVWRTDCDGAVVFETDGRTLRYLRWKRAFGRGPERERP